MDYHLPFSAEWMLCVIMHFFVVLCQQEYFGMHYADHMPHCKYASWQNVQHDLLSPWKHEFHWSISFGWMYGTIIGDA